MHNAVIIVILKLPKELEHVDLHDNLQLVVTTD
jgi:hypothetical protein